MKPDVYIGEGTNRFMKRWYLIPRNRFLNVMLHKIERNDTKNKCLHDHPFWNISIILKGGYIEFKPNSEVSWIYKHRWPGAIIFRKSTDPHLVKLRTEPNGADISCWSIWITGPVTRRWGFYTSNGWVHWRKYVSAVRAKNEQ